MHSKYNALESSWNHLLTQSVEKLSSMKLVSGAKSVGDHWFKVYSYSWRNNQASIRLVNVNCFLIPRGLRAFFFFSFIFISWRLITLQYCSGFCHTLTWISHGFTCIPHPDPPSHLPFDPIPLGLPSALGLSTCLMHPAWAGDLFHPR